MIRPHLQQPHPDRRCPALIALPLLAALTLGVALLLPLAWHAVARMWL